jgi:3-carboxy-cis,cis-muconate cycloisomerase
LPFEPLFVPAALREATGDRAWLDAMLEFERSLLAAADAAGLIEDESVLMDPGLDPEQIMSAGRAAGNPVPALVEALDRPNAHLGATSQDTMDSAAMLVARRARGFVDVELAGVASACASLADRHRVTPMAARTLLQQALPTTFGLKAAGWLVAVDEARDRLDAVPLEVQLGGAAGTLAAYGDKGTLMLSLMAHELGLAEPTLPWHTRRGRIGELGAALALAAGALEKIALDIKLLAQTEVGEVAESSEAGRGGSSTLPQKHNPVGAALTIACAHGARGAAAVLIDVQAQEHERAAGAWQAEWEALSRALALTGGAAASLRESLDGLEVFPERMRANLALTGGLVMTEAVSTALSERLGRSAAKTTLSAVAERGGSLRDELLADPAIDLSEDEIDRLLDPANYLGSAPAFVDRALKAHQERR